MQKRVLLSINHFTSNLQIGDGYVNSVDTNVCESQENYLTPVNADGKQCPGKTDDFLPPVATDGCQNLK